MRLELCAASGPSPNSINTHLCQISSQCPEFQIEYEGLTIGKSYAFVQTIFHVSLQTILLSLIALSLSLPAAPGWSIWSGGMWMIPDDDGEMTVIMIMMMIISLQVTTFLEWEAVTTPPRARLTSAPSTQQTRDVKNNT